MNKSLLTTLTVTAIVGLTMNASASAAQVSPFRDNVTINLAGRFTSPIELSYQNDNDVNIQGPATATPPAFPIAIYSNNEVENGFPSMTIKYGDSASCTLKFVDGPWTTFNYAAGTPPTCTGGLTVSTISSTGQYQYAITITKN